MEKEVKYIQLPPIPEDIEMPVLEAIWLIARMPSEEKKDAFKQIEAMLRDEEGYEKPDYDTVQAIIEKYSDVEDETIFSKYIDCFRRVLSGLILESYDIAAYVYQKRCVEGLSIEETMKTTRFSREQLNMFLRYFDIRYDAIANSENSAEENFM